MVGKITQVGITVRQGDSFDILMQFRNKNGQPFDISECFLKMEVLDLQKNKPLFSIDGEIVEPMSGKARIKVVPQHTIGKEVKDYGADIKLILKNGDVHTVYPQDINKIAFFRISKNLGV